jgi:hypothetical protein
MKITRLFLVRIVKDIRTRLETIRSRDGLER